MKRVIQTTQQPSSNTYNVTTKKVYTRFHRKPQVYQSTIQANKTYKVIDNLEKENINTLITNIYKEKKYRGVLDLTSPNNKNICIDTDSEHQKSEKGSGFSPKDQNKKSTKLLIAKTESQFPETYNSLNVFRKDGLVRGYYVRVSENRDKIKNYNTMTGNGRMIRTYIQTPSPEHEDRIGQDYNFGAQTQIRTKRINIDTKNIDRTYNRNTVQRKIFRREMDLDEWPSVEKQIKYIYRGNKDIQFDDKVMKNDNSNYSDYKNVSQVQAQNKTKKYPAGMVYRRTNMSEMRASYSQSHISDMSEDLLNQYKRQQINENNNYIIAGNASEIASPKGYRNNNDMLGTSEEESEHRTEVILYKDDDYQNYMNKNIISAEPNQDNYNYKRSKNIGKDIGGKVDLDLEVYNKRSEIRTKKIIIKKTVNIRIEEIIRRDERKLNSLIKLQRFIRSYLYLRELCAMKIQAIWRGGNTRKIMDLYNDLDEFIYHLSKVQFNHFNSNFCYFINQLFQIYKQNVSNGNDNENENEDESDNDNNNMENEEEENEENENCMNQISMEEMEQRENQEYLYKFPEGSYFDSDKLIPSNKINIFVGGSMSKDYERLRRKYEELYQEIYELRQRSNINTNYNIQTAKRKEKKDKNESESTIGSIKDEYKFKFGSISRDANTKVNSESRPSVGDNGKNTISNDEYDADLEINRDDDFFNQSYDDQNNSGSLKDKIYSYFSIHSDENSKYFDNENPRDRERDREGETRRITTSKTSGDLKFNNTEKYSGFSSRYNQSNVGLHRYDKNQNNYSNSPSLEKSNNYIGHHSKTFQRRYNYNDSINNNNLIIIKHEEDFGIINNNNLFLSPKEREESKKHKKNILSDIAITPIAQNIKMEEKNWNDIITYFKNEEIEIQTDKRKEKSKSQKDKEKERGKRTKDKGTEITTELFLYENEPISNEQFHLEKAYKKAGAEQFEPEQNVSNVNIIKNKIYKKPRKLLIRKNENINLIGLDRAFDSLEREYIEDLIIDNNDFKKKKMEQIYVEHENELNISSDRKSFSERKSLLKELKDKKNENLLLKKQLEDKDNKYSLLEIQLKERESDQEKDKETEQENTLLKKKLEGLMQKISTPKAYDKKLEINNNLNNLNITGVKPQIKEMLISKITSDNLKEEVESKVISEPKINEQYKTLLENKIKKDKEWNNLVINKTKRIDLKGEEIKSQNQNQNQIQQEEDNKDKGKDKNKEQDKDKAKDKDSHIDIASPEKEKLKLRIAIKKKSVSKKTKVKEIIEKEYQKVEVEKIEESKDRKESEVSQVSHDLDKDNKKVFNELQPHIQDNIRFSYIDKNKPEDNKSLRSSQNLEISSISKNDDVSIEATSERKIKISTKKVVRKNIIHHKFKNNEVVQENELNINGLRKKKNILKEESQNNNRFTVEKTSVSNQNKNVDNCIQINIDGIQEEQDKDKDKDKAVLEKIINEEITIVSKPKEVISLVAKNDEFSIEKTCPAITEKITDTSDLKQGQNNEIISENELYINAIRKKKLSLEPHSQENNRFTIEKTFKEANEASEVKDNEEHKYDDEAKVDNEMKENDENKTKKDKKKKKCKKHKKKKDKKEDIKDLETQDNVNEADNNLINNDEIGQDTINIENENENKENQNIETQEPENKEEVEEALRGRRINPEELEITQSVEYVITPSEEIVQERINEIISNSKKENLKSLTINKNDEVSLIPSNVFKREIKIVTRKTLKKTERLYTKFLNNKVIISPQNQVDIKGTEIKPESIMVHPQKDDNQDIEGRTPSVKVDETSSIASKVEPKEKEENKIVFKNNEISKNNEFVIIGIQKSSDKNIDDKEDETNKDEDNELIQSQESKESKEKEIRINQKKVIRKTNILPSEFTRNNEVINENKINLNGYGKKFDNIQLQNEEDKNNNRFSIEKDTKNQLLSKLSQIKPQENVFFEIEKAEKVPQIYEVDNKGPNICIEKEDKVESKEKGNIIANRKYNNIINIKNRFTLGGNELMTDKKQSDLKANDAFRKPINNVIHKISQFAIISRKPEENIINTKSQFTLRGQTRKPEEKIINTKSQFTLKGQSKKPEENIINTKSQFTLKGQTRKPEENIINTKSQFIIKGQARKPEENIINTKSQFTLKGQSKKPEENIINTKSQFTLKGQSKKPEENIMNIKSQFTIKASNKKPIDNIINTKSQFTITSTYKKPQENIINTKSIFTLKGIQKELKETGIQFEDNKDRLSDKNVDTSDLNSKEIRITMKKTVRKTNIFKNDFNNNKITSENKINIEGTQKPQIFNEEKLVKDIQQNEFEITKDPKKEEEEKLKKLQEINNAMEEQRFELNIEKEKEEKSDMKSFKEPISSKKDWNEIIKEDVQQNKFIIKKVKKSSDKKEKENVTKGKTGSDVNMNMTISTEVIIDYLGKEIEKEKQKLSDEKKEVRKDWNDLLKEEVQHNKFIIKRISKNIYNKLNQLQDIKNIKDSKDKEDIKEPSKLLEEENIDSQKPNKDEDNEQVILRNKQLLQSKQPLIKERDWTNTLKEEVQQGKFIIKGNRKTLPSVSDIPEQPEQISTLRPKKELPVSDNRIVKKIRFNIEANKYNTQQKTEPKFLSSENISNQNNWKDSLKEHVQQNKFVIKKVKTKAKGDDKFNEEKEKEFQRLKEMERQSEINKSKIGIEKNIEINVEPKDTLPLAKNKIIDNWKESISKEKSEELNIEKLPAKREIKIVTKRTLKKVENYYRKFNNLNTAQEQINIEGKQRTTDSELSSENSQITLNINKSYEPKKEQELTSEKNNELFIGSNKKKEIKITTKKRYTKTNYIHSRFNNTSISNEGKLNIERDERKQKEIEELQDKLKKENEGLQNRIKENEEKKDKLEKEKEELKDKLEKENEEMKDKLGKDNEELKKENEALKDKLEKEKEELKDKIEKENEEMKDKLGKDNEELKKENEALKNKLEKEKEKEKENEELRKKFNNLNITQDQIIINKSNESKKEYELTSEKNNELFINSNKKREIKITTKKRYAKTNYIHSRFNNILISDEGKLNIEGDESKQKLNEEIQDKLKKENEKLQNRIKENEDMKNKLGKDNEDLKKQNEDLKDKLQKEKENEELNDKLQKETQEFKNENTLLQDKIKEINLKQDNLQKENDELKNKIEHEKQKNKLNDKFKKETEDLKKENQKLKDELQKGQEKENEQLKAKMKENKDLHDKINQNNQMLDKLQRENEEMNLKLKELTKENKELKDNRSKDNENYSLKLSNDQVQKSPKLTKLENIPKKEEKEKEKEKDSGDSHKKKLIINTKKVIKRTNILKHSFKDNEVCSNVQLNINENINEKKMKEKPKSNLGLLEVKQNENIIIKQNRKKNLGNNIINKVLNIQLLNDKVHKTPDNITDNSFGDNYQLRNVKLQKSNQLTDKSQDVSEMGLYQTLDKNKSETDKSASYLNKGIDSEIDKEKSINIKTIKGKNINNLINQRYNNEDYSDSVNIDDKNTSSIEPNSSTNLADESKSGDKKKKMKVKHIQKKVNTTKYETNVIDTNINKLKQKSKDKKAKDTNKKSDDTVGNKNIQSFTANTLSSDDNINLISGSSMETDAGKRTSFDKDASEGDNLDKSKKKNIIINKKISIFSKKNKKIKLESTKRKFFERKQLIKFWKAWKDKIEKKKQKENEKLEMTSLDQKKTKKPFILKINKVSIKKKILELPKVKIYKQKLETQEKIVSLRNKLMIRNKALMMRHFFSKWKMDTESQNHISIGTINLRYILRRYIVRYLIMNAKIVRFRTILIKYSLRSHKNK